MLFRVIFFFHRIFLILWNLPVFYKKLSKADTTRMGAEEFKRFIARVEESIWRQREYKMVLEDLERLEWKQHQAWQRRSQFFLPEELSKIDDFLGKNMESIRELRNRAHRLAVPYSLEK